MGSPHFLPNPASLRVSYRIGHRPKRRPPPWPAVPHAGSPARYPTGPRLPFVLSPKGKAHCRTASYPIGALFPQRPPSQQPPASFPAQAVGAAQVRALARLRMDCPAAPDIVVADGKYGNAGFLQQVQGLRVSIVVRLPIGSPAREPKPRGKPPGGPKGRSRTPKARYKGVKKGVTTAQTAGNGLGKVLFLTLTNRQGDNVCLNSSKKP